MGFDVAQAGLGRAQEHGLGRLLQVPGLSLDPQGDAQVGACGLGTPLQAVDQIAQGRFEPGGQARRGQALDEATGLREIGRSRLLQDSQLLGGGVRGVGGGLVHRGVPSCRWRRRHGN